MILTLKIDATNFAELIENHPALAELISNIILRKECEWWREEEEA